MKEKIRNTFLFLGAIFREYFLIPVGIFIFGYFLLSWLELFPEVTFPFLIALILYFTFWEGRKTREFKRLAFLDELTGLYNLRYFKEILEKKLKKAKRKKKPLTLGMMDLDGFKEYNDRWGHPEGDVALRKVAEVLKRNLRRTDILARYGGDEFCVLFPSTQEAEAEKILKRIARLVSSTPLPKTSPPLSLSFGIASFPSQAKTKDDLIQKADRSLYQKKNSA